jgi:hypothetical protein
MAAVQLHISFSTHTQGKGNTVHGASTGPHLHIEDLHNPARVSAFTRMAHGLLDISILDLLEIISKKPSSLPEKIDNQPHYLFLARQWLALVENGKQQARCMAVELPSGERQITITIQPEKRSGP